MVRFEEVLDDDCRCAVDCFANLDESSIGHFMNTMVRTGHPDHRHTSHNHLVLDSGHRAIGHDRRSITFGYRGGNRRQDIDDPVTVGAHHPYYGRIDARPTVSSCF